jgi:uncharacterized protein (TIGR00255 family)
MASSMTGLGVGEVREGGMTVVVELKSVNNRFLEISCRIPSVIACYEQEIREIIRSQITRGKLYVTIAVQDEVDGTLDIRVDSEMAKRIRRLLDELRQATGVEEELCLEHFLKFSEIFEPLKEPEDGEKIWENLRVALTKALTDLKEMRDKEGSVLVRDIVGRVQDLEEHIDAIERIAQENLQNKYEKMVSRVQRLIKDRELDEERLNAEVVLMADRMDVTEECVRLRSHNQLFFRILEKEAAIGKKLNFLLQEMNREVNTISAKALNAEISHLVVEMKEEIEKIREQVQNLE